MGRELIQIDDDEWWITETHSGYCCRVSKSFKSKEEAIETLRKGNCDEQILKTFEGDNGIHSMNINKNGQFRVLGVEIDEALHNANALCPDGEHSLFEDVECAVEDCEHTTLGHYMDVETKCCECED
jgi:hypothetical protein